MPVAIEVQANTLKLRELCPKRSYDCYMDVVQQLRTCLSKYKNALQGQHYLCMSYLSIESVVNNNQ